MRSLLSALIAAVATWLPAAHADNITLKNGQKLEGSITGLKDGHIEMQVFSMYVGGYPATTASKVRVSNIRSIAFDGRDDFFAIVKKNDDVVDAQLRELANGKLKADGHDPISMSAVKALTPTKPNATTSDR